MVYSYPLDYAIVSLYVWRVWSFAIPSCTTFTLIYILRLAPYFSLVFGVVLVQQFFFGGGVGEGREMRHAP
jgi:hypothetical protein